MFFYVRNSAHRVKFVQNQTIMVTGAGSGIGRKTAARLHAGGGRVILADVDESAARKAAYGLGGGAAAVAMDVTSEASVAEGFDAAEAQFGPVDGLFANAGVSSMKRSDELSVEDWDFNMDVNAKGVFLTNREMLRRCLKRGGGTVVNNASLAAKMGAPFLAHYSASKFAVLGWTQAVAREYGPRGIRINAVCPGYVATPMQDREVVWEAELTGSDPDSVRESYKNQAPLKRLASTDDVAGAVAFLFSDSSKFITGQALVVDGGVHMG